MKRCLAFDTSNYTTSAALYGEDVALNQSRLLPVPPGRAGLRQSDALFAHIKALPELFAELMRQGGREFDALSVSDRPRDVEGSYMPCFLAGVQAAGLLAAASDVPLFCFSHQQGHMAAAAFSAGRVGLLREPFLAWHLSGGTTELLYVRPDPDRLIVCEKIGGTSDISAGQCVDRLGVALGLSFPCGPELERLSLTAGGEKAPRFVPRLDGLTFSLSGLESKFKKQLEEGMNGADAALFVLESIGEALKKTTGAALRRYPGLPVLCSGGVMSCAALRATMEDGFGAWTASPQHARDNALGVALLGRMKME